MTAEGVIIAVCITQRANLAEIELDAVHRFGCDMGGENISYKHLMAAKVHRLEYTALDRNRTLRYHRGGNMLARLGGEMTYRKLVDILAGVSSAVIYYRQQSFIGNVHNKLARFLYVGVAVAGRLNRNIKSEGVGRNDTRPGNGEHLGVVNCSAGNECYRSGNDGLLDDCGGCCISFFESEKNKKGDCDPFAFDYT